MRSLSTIAREIKLDWGHKVHYSAEPYLSAMLQLDKISDQYGDDSARMIVAYFVGNARTWRGEVAKRVKLELNTMLKG